MPHAQLMTTIARVWIEDGCIGCGWCIMTCPAVFTWPQGDALIRGESRLDGVTSANRMERSLLTAAGQAEALLIAESAEGCPVEVIRSDDGTALRAG